MPPTPVNPKCAGSVEVRSSSTGRPAPANPRSSGSSPTSATRSMVRTPWRSTRIPSLNTGRTTYVSESSGAILTESPCIEQGEEHVTQNATAMLVLDVEVAAKAAVKNFIDCTVEESVGGKVPCWTHLGIDGQKSPSKITTTTESRPWRDVSSNSSPIARASRRCRFLTGG
ncbi:unnamed protein product [Prorocentrum cordatum]|uniref:Uncharacterized protein n=1 Tax=Prorocentrum cordatum TaxID=2364126 RepID=A0ABN9Q9D2_9DINO|nr:unnamed protein product [Polarella glacialis]